MSQTGMSQEDIRRIAEAIASKLAGAAPAALQNVMAAAPKAGASLGDGIFTTIDDAAKAARAAFGALSALGLEQRKQIIESMRKVMRANAEHLAKMAHEESGLGRYEDKVVKNLLVTNKTPGPEDLAPTAVSGDRGLVLIETRPGAIQAVQPAAPAEPVQPRRRRAAVTVVDEPLVQVETGQK